MVDYSKFNNIEGASDSDDDQKTTVDPDKAEAWLRKYDELAKDHATLDCTIKGPVECAALGMGAYLGVAQGASSDNEAQFIHLTYKRGVPKTKLAIVGKGLTYDSGGYNLKPSAGGMIELMKFDMGGFWPVSVSYRRWRRRGRERVTSSS